MAERGQAPDPPTPGSSDLESTATLLKRIQDGDSTARDPLIRRYLPILLRWAHGRLPARARDLGDTDDLVQVTLLRALDRVKEFEPRREGAFLAYLRRILQNQIRDQIRRVGRRPEIGELKTDIRGEEQSPLESAIGRERLEAYEAALAKLPDQQREAIVLRIEMGYTHQEVAEAVGCPTANAARMLVARALVRLAESLDGR